MTPATPVKLVAIVGGSGAGKGWLVHRLCELLGDKVCHLQLDDFYLDCSHLAPTERARVNFDIPTAIDWAGAERVLRACRAGEATSVPRYDFATHSRLSDELPWAPRPLVLVDGLWLLRAAAMRRLFNLSIFLDAPADLRHTRRLARDTTERGYSPAAVEHRFRTEVGPMHDRYVEPQKNWADLVLTQPFLETDLVQLADRLSLLLSDASPLQPWNHETFRADLVAQLANHEYCN